MEALTRLVSESLARHGFDRPVDYRRLQWSRWFRCESHHSLLVVPSKPGVFALAEEIINFGTTADQVEVGASMPHVETAAATHVETAAAAVPRSEASGAIPKAGSQEPKADARNRMLAVTKFFEDDDMAFVLDSMLSHQNPMRARLASGRYFVRFVEIHDQIQRRSICSALNQWIISSAEKATGIGSHFATSLELTPEPSNITRSLRPDSTDCLAKNECGPPEVANTSRLNSAVATTIHCSSSFPSGF
ncbi:MAG TPA: hypothetical protein VJP02_14575 [Candidatus Sulfotelmatobacter sp.]|nr:hypothetical protein [Candidatus Sulfotelmatobacter sp.]